MTKEEIQEYLNSDDGKAVFSELFNSTIKEKGYKAPDEIKGLEAKRDELLKKVVENKNNQEKYLTTFKKHGILDLDDLDNILSSTPEVKNKAEDLERKTLRLERELEAERKSKADFENALKAQKDRFMNAEKEKAILKALSSVNIDESASDILSVYFDKLATVEEDETGNLSILANDGAQSKPLNEFIQEWSKTDKAKHYIKAPLNAGAGSSSQGQVKPTMTLQEIALLPKEQIPQALADNGI